MMTVFFDSCAIAFIIADFGESTNPKKKKCLQQKKV